LGYQAIIVQDNSPLAILEKVDLIAYSHTIFEEGCTQAKDKKAAIGPDIDLSSFTADSVEYTYLNDLTKLPAIDQLTRLLILNLF
jgi:hypothetical protein